MASTHGPDLFLDETGKDSGRVPTAARPSRPFPHFGAAGVMLGIGVVTFVVSGSLAIGLQLTAGDGTKAAEKPAAVKSADAPAAVKSVAPAPAAPRTVEMALPPPPPPAEPPPPPEAAIEPEPVADPLVPDAPAPDPLAPADGTLAGAPPAPGALPVPEGVTPVPGLVPAPVTPVPQQNQGILHRLKEKIAGIGQPDPAQAPADVVPPQDPLLVPPPPAPEAPPPPAG